MLLLVVVRVHVAAVAAGMIMLEINVKSNAV